MDDDELQRLYAWVDEIPLSRPKRNIARDFADGVLAAEVCHHYFPRLVDLHNYPPANSMRQKLYNWDTLNARVLRKLDAALPRADVEAVCQCAPGAVERVLNTLQLKMARYRANQQRRKEAESHHASEQRGRRAPTREGQGFAPGGRRPGAPRREGAGDPRFERDGRHPRAEDREARAARALKDAKIQKLKDAAAGRR